MSESIYDTHVAFYIDFVDQALANQSSLLNLLLTHFTQILGNRLLGARVGDIACGEGYFSRFLGQLGPQEVIGIDISTALIKLAIERSHAANVSFRVDDAQSLRTFPDASLDIAVSQMAIMDIPDHRALFRSVRRVLRNDGVFVFSLLHPCFEAPFHLPDKSPILVDAHETPIACLVHRYASEGYWQSGGTGVRGHMGAYHRTLSTLLNDLLDAGFLLERLDEPVNGTEGLSMEIPRTLLVTARTR